MDCRGDHSWLGSALDGPKFNKRCVRILAISLQLSLHKCSDTIQSTVELLHRPYQFLQIGLENLGEYRCNF